MSKAKTITLWVVSGLCAALFIAVGSVPFLKPEMAKAGMVKYGYPEWFSIFIGTCEFLGGVALLIPRLAGLAAAGLAIIMAGAVYTHLSHAEMKMAPAPFVLLLLLLWVSYTRFKRA